MKQRLKAWTFAALFSTIAIAAAAQEPEPPQNFVPAWSSNKGYWVVEGNINTPLHNTVRFYTNDHVLVYTETIDGVKLNVEKRRVKMKLKKALESSVTAWQQTRQQQQNQSLVAALFK